MRYLFYTGIWKATSL